MPRASLTRTLLVLTFACAAWSAAVDATVLADDLSEPDVREPARAPIQPFGLITDLAFVSPDQEDYKLYHGSGAQWARERLRWDRVGDRDGHHQWSQPRPVVGQLSAVSDGVLGVLSHPPRGWVEGRPAGYVPTPLGPDAAEDWSTFVNSAGRAMAQYVDAWEVWDRPNDSSTWKPRPHADDYVALLRATHGTLATRDPGAKLVLGATADVDDYYSDGIRTRVSGLYWIESLLDRGVGEYVDAVAVHPEGANPEQASSDVAEMVRLLEGREDAVTLGVWVTDIGWSLDELDLEARRDGWTAAEAQAAYVARTYVTLLSMPRVDRVFWRALHERGSDGDYAIVSLDGTPRPAYHAYRTVVSMLDQAMFVEQVQGPAVGRDAGDASGPYELRFERLGQTVAAIWFADGGMTLREVTVAGLPPGRRELVALDGTSTVFEPIDGPVVVQANEAPSFVVVTPTEEPEPHWTQQLVPARSDLDADPLRDGASRLAGWLRHMAELQVAEEADPRGGKTPSSTARAVLDAIARKDRQALETLLDSQYGRPAGALFALASSWLSASGFVVDPTALEVSLNSSSPNSASVRVLGRLPVSHKRGDVTVRGSVPIDITLSMRHGERGWVVTGAR